MRSASSAIAVAACALLLAGCVAPATVSPSAANSSARTFAPLTAATHHLARFLNFSIPSFDGTPIHVDVEIPNGTGPFPVYVDYTPYSSLGSNEEGAVMQVEGPLGSPYALTLDSYLTYGYAVAVADVRGTGESGGCLEVGGPDEGKDGYALVEALAKEPWSNGKIALGGTSWDGTTPLETAVLHPPHLAAVVAMSPVTDWYRYYFELGTHRRNGDTFPGSSDTDPAFDAFLGGVPGLRTATVNPTKLSCVAQFTSEDDLQDNRDAYWLDRDIASHAGNITTAVLYAQGWEDENVATSMIPDFWSNLTAPKHAWLEQHGHGVPGSKKGYYDYMHRFLDHYLLGRDNGAELGPAVVIEDNTGHFRTEATWPPADAWPLVYNLSAGGALVAGAATQGRATYHDDGTGEEAPQLAGVDHLEFKSAPLNASLHVAGVPSLHLTFATDSPDTQVDVKVYAVAANGSSLFITRGYLDLKHRDSLEKASTVTAGQAYNFTFALHPRDVRIPAGDSILLVVKSTDDYVVRSPYRATNTLTLGGMHAWLDLPSIADAGRVYTAAPPTPWGNASD
ncbi:MAG: CocE/NonD family hydrolase [Thermoplasmatota archaeon]